MGMAFEFLMRNIDRAQLSFTSYQVATWRRDKRTSRKIIRIYLGIASNGPLTRACRGDLCQSQEEHGDGAHPDDP